MKCLLLVSLTSVMFVVKATEKNSSQIQRNTVQTNVKRLEKTVKELISAMREMKTDQSNVKSEVDAVRSSIKRFFADNRRRRRTKVAFEVLQETHASFGLNEPFKFDHVALNTGNGYSSRSGFFRVPITGTYLLWANINCHGAGYFLVSLMKEDEELTQGYTGSSNSYGTATINHVVKLKKGDHVWFAFTLGTSKKVVGDRRSSYGGILMYT